MDDPEVKPVISVNAVQANEQVDAIMRFVSYFSLLDSVKTNGELASQVQDFAAGTCSKEKANECCSGSAWSGRRAA